MKSQIHEHQNQENMTVSKALITLILLISVIVSGFTSYQLFRQSDYNVSALLTITSYLSIVMSIFALTVTSKKKTTALQS
jgi:heme/copper-type cytochrome/quinol oxidase subunit 3